MFYRSTSSPVQITAQNKIGSVNSSTTSFNDPNLANGNYYYVVTAAYNQGESGPSNQASAQIGGALNPPKNLVATASGNSVALRWEAPAPNATSTVVSLPKVFNFAGAINTAVSLSKKVQPAPLNILNTNIPEVEPNNLPEQAQPLQGASPLRGLFLHDASR